MPPPKHPVCEQKPAIARAELRHQAAARWARARGYATACAHHSSVLAIVAEPTTLGIVDEEVRNTRAGDAWFASRLKLWRSLDEAEWALARKPLECGFGQERFLHVVHRRSGAFGVISIYMLVHRQEYGPAHVVRLCVCLTSRLKRSERRVASVRERVRLCRLVESSCRKGQIFAVRQSQKAVVAGIVDILVPPHVRFRQCRNCVSQCVSLRLSTKPSNSFLPRQTRRAVVSCVFVPSISCTVYSLVSFSSILKFSVRV